MNRVFKTKWSVAHQEYVVTDEKHTTKTKTAKSAVALAVAALMLGAGVASAAYMDPGFVAKNSTQLEQAKKSWETAEYQKDWGLAAMNASTAYALGYHGQNTAVAVMDSGALLQKHPELAGDRFHASHALIACLWLTDDSLDYAEVKQILCGKPESLCRISRL